jgi:N-acetylglucosamine-6-sulfatase
MSMNRRTGRWLLLSVALPLLFAAGTGGGRAEPAEPLAAAARPNVVLILTDDQDLDLGSLQYMPLLRALVGDAGTTFSSHFVSLSLCCPSRATILRGQYAHNHQVFSNIVADGSYVKFHALGREGSTVATALHDAGYRTALLGKYLNRYPTSSPAVTVPPGWDEWDVPVAGGAYRGSSYVLNQNGALLRFGADPASYLTDVLAARARKFIRDSAAAGAPFFVYFAPYAPHVPAQPAARHAQLFKNLRAPRTPSFDEADVSDKPERVRRLAPLSPEEIAALDELYRNRIRSLQSVDEAIGALVEELRAAGQLDNTYLLFTSDNGFHMGQHRLRPAKYTAYESDIRVPLVVRGPGVPARRVVSALTSSVDLAPTIAELAGTALHHPADGRSLVRLLHGEPVPAGWRKVIFLEQFESAEPATGESGILEPADPANAKAGAKIFRHLGLRSAGFKYIASMPPFEEYYDLAADPDEMDNRAPRLPAAYRGRLSALARAFSSCAGKSCRDLESRPLPLRP